MSVYKELFKCPHDFCLYKSERGLIFECTNEENLKIHCSKVQFHPCCKDQTDACEAGKKIEKWDNSSINIFPNLMIPCIHHKCDKKFRLKISYDAHIKEYHDCVDNFGYECQTCDENAKRGLLVKEAKKKIRKKKEIIEIKRQVEEELWVQQKMESTETEEMDSDFIFINDQQNTDDMELGEISFANIKKLPPSNEKRFEINSRCYSVAIDEIDDPKPCKNHCGVYR